LNFDGRRVGWGEANGGRRRSRPNECGRAQKIASRQAVHEGWHCCFLLEFGVASFFAAVEPARVKAFNHPAPNRFADRV
jgi:hypothetical protein